MISLIVKGVNKYAMIFRLNNSSLINICHAKVLNLPIILSLMRRAGYRLGLFLATIPFLASFGPPANKKLSGIQPVCLRAASIAVPAPLVHPPAATEVLVAAAADLKFAMDSVVTVFTKENPSVHVKVVYGSSGNFYEQISNGAPFDLFFSADIDYPRRLGEQHKTLSDTKPYGTGQLVLWSKKLDPSAAEMNTLLKNNVNKIAIANPAHAPYGKRAEESLRFYKLYDKINDKLVFGENIAQTALYATTGAADVGIIALSLALSPTLRDEGGKYWLIPAKAHQPLQQGYVLLPHAKDNTGASAFAAFFLSAKTASILQSFGFGKP
jgi:molybdate transport system substrate-binding protein